jgi:6-hydroxycyclohex-1-ene-1-carbonyl-CoA dehydrogenase
VPAVLPCGECDLCRRGLSTICARQKMPGNDIQGGFASHMVVLARGLCPVDAARRAADGLAPAPVSIVADTLTTPYQAVRRAGVSDRPPRSPRGARAGLGAARRRLGAG